MLSNQVSKVTGGSGPSTGLKIEWEDFNFPPLFRLVHFSLAELPPDYKRVVRMIFLSFVFLIANQTLNLINQIAQVVEGEEGIRIFYAFLNIFIYLPVGMFTFYRGYKGLCADKSLLLIYKILQLALAVNYILFAILDSGASTGFVRVKDLLDMGWDFSGGLGVVESILYLLNALLAVFTVWQVHTFIPEREKPQTAI